MDAKKVAERLLHEYGYRLINKQWRSAKGVVLVTPNAGDWRGWKNALASIREQIAELPISCKAATFTLEKKEKAEVGSGVIGKPGEKRKLVTVVAPPKTKGIGIYYEGEEEPLTPEQVARLEQERVLKLERQEAEQAIEVMCTSIRKDVAEFLQAWLEQRMKGQPEEIRAILVKDHERLERPVTDSIVREAKRFASYKDKKAAVNWVEVMKAMMKYSTLSPDVDLGYFLRQHFLSATTFYLATKQNLKAIELEDVVINWKMPERWTVPMLFKNDKENRNV